MGDADKTKIQSSFQEFLTDPRDSNRDMSSILPTSDSVRFIQFCRLMHSGFGMKCFKDIADQAEAIMVSKDGRGRDQAVDSLVGMMDRFEKDKWRMGPQGRAAEDAGKGK